MVNVHARYLDVLETEGWLDRGLEFLPDRQADRRAPVAGARAARRPSSPCSRLHEERQHRPRSSQPTCPTTRTLEPDLVALLPGAAARALRRRDPRPPAAPRDHRHAGRQPDGQPVGHLVRPPHDRGHRGVGRRRDPGLGRGPRHLRLRRAVGRDRRARRASPLDTQLELFLDCRRMVERGALWLLRHRRPPLDIAAAVAQFRPGHRARWRRRSSRRSPAGCGRSCTRARPSRLAAGVPEALAERAGVWPLLHTGFDLVELAERARPSRRRGGRASTGRCSTRST